MQKNTLLQRPYAFECFVNSLLLKRPAFDAFAKEINHPCRLVDVEQQVDAGRQRGERHFFLVRKAISHAGHQQTVGANHASKSQLLSQHAL